MLEESRKPRWEKVYLVEHSIWGWAILVMSASVVSSIQQVWNWLITKLSTMLAVEPRSMYQVLREETFPIFQLKWKNQFPVL
jgi:hypothetical protein